MSSTQDIVNHVHDQVHAVNPFQSRSEYPRRSIIAYRITTTLTYLLLVITSIYYTFSRPHEGHHKHDRGTIWGINSRNHTPFALSAPIVTVYWIILYTLQVPYLFALYPQTELPSSHLKHACDLAPHFVAHNLLAFGGIHLWCRSFFGWALLLDIIDFFQLTIAYFRYPKTPRTMHVAVIAGPLAMSFVSLYWVGAAAVHARHFAARVAANVFVWTWVVYGGFYIVVFKDWAVGFGLSALSAALGVAQFLTVIVAIQWIFAFAIMALLFVGSAAVAAPGLVGWEPKRGAIVSEDREREPLLGDRAA